MKKTVNLAVLKKLNKIEHCTYMTMLPLRCLNPKWLYKYVQKKLSRILFDELMVKQIIG